MKKLTSFIAGLGLVLGSFSSASAVDVDLELGLIIDSSASIVPADWLKQIAGYVNAFNDATIRSAILSKSVVVNVVQFAKTASVKVASTLLDSDAAIDGVRDAIFALGTSQMSEGITTNTEEAIRDALDDLEGNNYDGAAKLIDISTDGDPTVSAAGLDPAADALAAATDAAAAGFTINAIGVGLPNLTFLESLVAAGQPPANAGFVISAASFDEFGDKIIEKIGLEVADPNPVPNPSPVPSPTPVPNPSPVPSPTPVPNPAPAPVPEPGTILLLGTGLVGLVGYQWKRRKK